MSSLHRRLRRALAVFVAAMLVVVPTWSTARSMAVACAVADGAPAMPMDEEIPHEALPPADVEVHSAAHRRDDRVGATGIERRHQVEYDCAVAARRWASYRAPPRAPPHRLLN